jgi:hypothetical protein
VESHKIWGIRNGILIDRVTLSSTTSDDITNVRKILDEREKYVHARHPFSQTAFQAWYHAPLCPARVLTILRSWLLPPHDPAIASVISAAANDGPSSSAVTGGARTQQARIVLIPAGPLLRTWTFEDIAFAQMLAPIHMTRFVILGVTDNVGQVAWRFRRYRNSFRVRCKAARDEGHPKMLCEARSSLSLGGLDDVWRFRGFDCFGRPT